MKSSSLVKLALVAVVVLAVGLWLKTSDRAPKRSSVLRAEGTLLSDLPLNEVARIRIAGPDGSVSVVRGDAGWSVPERYDYPADYGKVSQLVKQLANEQIAQTITVSPGNYGRLQLLPPDSGEGSKAGTNIELADRDGNTLATVRLGKKQMAESGSSRNPMMRGGPYPKGRYVLLPDAAGSGGQVVVVANPFRSVDVDPTAWLDKQFLELRGVERAWLERGQEKQWEIRTDPETDKLVLAGDIPEDKTVKTSALSATTRALAYATFEDVADPELSPADTGMDEPAVFHAVNEDCVACTVKIGAKADGNYYVQASLDYQPPKEEGEDDDSEESRGGPSDDDELEPEEVRRKARDLDRKLDGWTYLLPKGTADKLLRRREDFKEEKEEESGDKAGKAQEERAAPQKAVEKTERDGDEQAVEAPQQAKPGIGETDTPPPPPPPEPGAADDE